MTKELGKSQKGFIGKLIAASRGKEAV